MAIEVVALDLVQLERGSDETAPPARAGGTTAPRRDDVPGNAVSTSRFGSNPYDQKSSPISRRAAPNCSSTNGNVTLVADVSREFRQRDRLGALERLEDRDRQPGMLFDQGTADAERVHDRKKAGPPIPVGRGRLRVGKQIADIGMPAIETGRRPRPDHRVEFATRQQLGDGGVRPAFSTFTSAGRLRLIFSTRPGCS